MKRICSIPPDCCVSIEMEKGAVIGYRKAVLLTEIQALGSLVKAAKMARMEKEHAIELIRELNDTFRRPLVRYEGDLQCTDLVYLTAQGQRMVASYWKQFEPVWQSIIEERSRHF